MACITCSTNNIIPFWKLAVSFFLLQASLTIIPNILEDKPDLEIETLDTSTGLLKPITIEVGYEGLCIIPDVKWTYNGSPINRSIWRIDTNMNRSILYSANAHISDKGVYECEIRDHVTNTILKTRSMFYPVSITF